MQKLSYRILLRPEPEGGYTVIVPSLPGCVTYGKTVREARAMAADAIQAYLASVRKHGEQIIDDAETFEGTLQVSIA
jgi:predicted RNase H-like HicB family nuclease